jgi:hypothetical protein
MAAVAGAEDDAVKAAKVAAIKARREEASRPNVLKDLRVKVSVVTR